ncbi:MAG: hypothetical protein QF449_16515 [Alphaproteobacteria bacterium]|jgi:hypothetical protein|nr:hypothetical protein [Alphaproteobacteria bacterium]MDP6589818.1 hypothetical protein [Alphaproteobacteria bacterium]MDP6819620.1 hypothetical protein [Alphaproteobacteria bacterium]|tara:strand:+ start:1817 stop:1993 length:177 start_codon:yes stop_codon:yes gene_type:complete
MGFLTVVKAYFIIATEQFFNRFRFENGEKVGDAYIFALEPGGYCVGAAINAPSQGALG